MTKIKLADGTIINASDVEQAGDLLFITTEELTVEELAALLSDKSKTATIVLMTESNAETGRLEHYTGFSGIMYTLEGVKTVSLVYEAVDGSAPRLDALERDMKEVTATMSALLGTEE